jgi:hypothetical protein
MEDLVDLPAGVESYRNSLPETLSVSLPAALSQRERGISSVLRATFVVTGI